MSETDKSIDEVLDALRLGAPAECRERLARAFNIIGFLSEVSAVEGRAVAEATPSTENSKR